MAELHFESKEVEEYYRKERRVLGVAAQRLGNGHAAHPAPTAAG